MIKGLSVVVGVRNRKENLIRFLDSFVIQSLPKKYFEVIVVDYGGSDNLNKLMDKYSKLINLKYIYVKTELKWNEARAKNIGVKNSKNDFVICTNADIIFEKNALKKIFEFVKNRNRNYLYLLNRWDMLENGEIILADAIAMGDFQAMFKKNWIKLRGYDESMTGWGGLDPDLKFRANRLGIRDFRFDENKIRIYHHFHESKYSEKEDFVNFQGRKPIIFKVNPECFGDVDKISKREF